MKLNCNHLPLISNTEEGISRPCARHSYMQLYRTMHEWGTMHAADACINSIVLVSQSPYLALKVVEPDGASPAMNASILHAYYTITTALSADATFVCTNVLRWAAPCECNVVLCALFSLRVLNGDCRKIWDFLSALVRFLSYVPCIVWMVIGEAFGYPQVSLCRLRLFVQLINTWRWSASASNLVNSIWFPSCIYLRWYRACTVEEFSQSLGAILLAVMGGACIVCLYVSHYRIISPDEVARLWL